MYWIMETSFDALLQIRSVRVRSKFSVNCSAPSVVLKLETSINFRVAWIEVWRMNIPAVQHDTVDNPAEVNQAWMQCSTRVGISELVLMRRCKGLKG